MVSAAKLRRLPLQVKADADHLFEPTRRRKVGCPEIEELVRPEDAQFGLTARAMLGHDAG